MRQGLGLINLVPDPDEVGLIKPFPEPDEVRLRTHITVPDDSLKAEDSLN